MRRSVLAAAVTLAAATPTAALAADHRTEQSVEALRQAKAPREAESLGGAPALGEGVEPSLADLRADRRAAVALLDTAWGQAVDVLVGRMGSDPRAEPAWRALQRSQESWTEHRNADCREAAPALLEPLPARRATMICEIAKTRARAVELADRYELNIARPDE